MRRILSENPLKVHSKDIKDEHKGLVHIACVNNDLEMVKILKEFGANLD